MTEATDAKNSEGLVTGTISRQTAIKDGWDSNELEEEDTMDGDEGKTEELAYDNEKARNLEDKNTNRNKGGKDKENGEEIEPSNGQKKPKNQEMDEGYMASEVAVKESTMEENKHKDKDEEETKDNNLNTTNNTDTGRISLEMRTNKMIELISSQVHRLSRRQRKNRNKEEILS